jgi:hypothetical protein
MWSKIFPYKEKTMLILWIWRIYQVKEIFLETKISFWRKVKIESFKCISSKLLLEVGYIKQDIQATRRTEG